MAKRKYLDEVPIINGTVSKEIKDLDASEYGGTTVLKEVNVYPGNVRAHKINDYNYKRGIDLRYKPDSKNESIVLDKIRTLYAKDKPLEIVSPEFDIIASIGAFKKPVVNTITDALYKYHISKNHTHALRNMVDAAFVKRAKNSKYIVNNRPIKMYHGSPTKDITSFKTKRSVVGARGTGEEGLYVTPKYSYADRYRAKDLMRDTNYPANQGKIYEFYVNAESPIEFNFKNFPNKSVESFYKMSKVDRQYFENLGYDALNSNLIKNKPETVVFRPNQLKFASVITKDNKGKLIPLSKRFNFSNADSRYKYGGSIHIKPSHRGRLTELKARTGKSEAELYSDGNPAHKKMVVFARNARKWKH